MNQYRKSKEQDEIRNQVLKQHGQLLVIRSCEFKFKKHDKPLFISPLLYRGRFLVCYDES